MQIEKINKIKIIILVLWYSSDPTSLQKLVEKANKPSFWEVGSGHNQPDISSQVMSPSITLVLRTRLTVLFLSNGVLLSEFERSFVRILSRPAVAILAGFWLCFVECLLLPWASILINTDVSGAFRAAGGLLTWKIWPKIDQVTPILVSWRPPLSFGFDTVATGGLFCDYFTPGRPSYADLRNLRTR